jgi:hypothetical protein
VKRKANPKRICVKPVNNHCCRWREDLHNGWHPGFSWDHGQARIPHRFFQLSSANLSIFVTLNDLFFKVASQGKLSGINYCRALNQLFTEMEQNQDAVHKVLKVILTVLW